MDYLPRWLILGRICMWVLVSSMPPILWVFIFSKQPASMIEKVTRNITGRVYCLDLKSWSGARFDMQINLQQGAAIWLDGTSFRLFRRVLLRWGTALRVSMAPSTRLRFYIWFCNSRVAKSFCRWPFTFQWILVAASTRCLVRIVIAIGIMAILQCRGQIGSAN